MKKYKTEARPEPKNEIWEQEVDGQLYICERPHYLVKKLEIELLSAGFERESLLIFGKVLPFFFDKEGRWWVHPTLCSQGMLELFIKGPAHYMEIIAHKIKTVKKIIPILKEIEPDLYTDDTEKLKINFNKLFECLIEFYSYHFITFIVSDEIVLRFRKILQKFLSKSEANVYFSDFLRAEMTREAIKVGAVEETIINSRDLMYSKSKPVIFYKEPKLFFESDYDNKIVSKLHASDLSPEVRQEFFALRIITPIVIQINEEAQYIESKMLLPMMKITLEKIKEVFVKEGLIKEEQDIRDLSKDEILTNLSKLSEKKKKIAQGLGVSPGQVQGRVKIIKNFGDHPQFQEGDILVTRLTDPTMVILMNKAAGIICDIGGLTSHPSIVSREMGIPCIVSAKCVETGKGISETIKEGVIVQICGQKGEIHVIKNDS